MEKVIEGLKEEMKRSTDDKTSLRKGLAKELQAFKEQNAEMLKRQIAKYVKQKDQITVSYFDSLLGVDAETLRLVN